MRCLDSKFSMNTVVYFVNVHAAGSGLKSCSYAALWPILSEGADSSVYEGTTSQTYSILKQQQPCAQHSWLAGASLLYTSCCSLYRTRSAMVMQRSPCCLANSRSCGVLDMEPSSGFTTSQRTPAPATKDSMPGGGRMYNTISAYGMCSLGRQAASPCVLSMQA